ncbi:hypothetical protein FYJ57_05035 [Lachnospiraceae bacterium BSM-380-WT-5A]|uniref:Uncharacterized protein n=1 Tax=Oliverpabstia intestinalis TaxID=2606633 RepID=A0A7X2P263_9FIRM|nr:hypothetical protein [Oliverpabstia intestinalis]
MAVKLDSQKSELMYIENFMSCIICQHRCHDPVRLYSQASVEDTPETTGKFVKKLPVIRNILIEVSCNTDSR